MTLFVHLTFSIVNFNQQYTPIPSNNGCQTRNRFYSDVATVKKPTSSNVNAEKFASIEEDGITCDSANSSQATAVSDSSSTHSFEKKYKTEVQSIAISIDS